MQIDADKLQLVSDAEVVLKRDDPVAHRIREALGEAIDPPSQTSSSWTPKEARCASGWPRGAYIRSQRYAMEATSALRSIVRLRVASCPHFDPFLLGFTPSAEVLLVQSLR